MDDARAGSEGRWPQGVIGAILLLAMGFFLTGLSPAAAQGQNLTGAFGGFAASPDKPIDIQAARLDVDDRAKRAVFSGGVVASQDTFTMNSSTLEVFYASRSGAKPAAASAGFGGGSSEIVRLLARGKVRIVSSKQQQQSASGNWAEFNVKERIIRMGDQVTLQQGKNIIRGKQLFINLNTGRSSVVSGTTSSSASDGRIRMIITPDKSTRNRFKRPVGGSQ